MNKDNKVIKFPSHRVKRPRWLMRIRNVQKANIVNFLISLVSVLVGLAIVGFMVHKMNL